MENNDFMKLLHLYFNRFFYSCFFPIILAVISYSIYKITKANVILITLVDVIIILYWLFKLIVIPKNKTKKYGIVFLINNGELYNENIYSMIKKIQFELQDNFKIFAFYNNFMKNINTQKRYDKYIFKKNYHMIINLFSLSAKENAERVCSLTNKNITFLTFGQKLDEEVIQKLQKDFSFGFRKILKLSEKNSFVDINQNADIMSLSIRYFVSIIYIIFNQVDLAEHQLKLMDFSNVDTGDKIVQYLRKNSVRRYAEIYYIRIFMKLNDYKYLYDETELKELNKLVEKFNIFVNSDPNLTDFRYLANDINSKVLFAKGDYFNSLGNLVKMQKKNPNDYIMLLNKAFVEINQGNTKGFETYKKISKRKDINNSVIERCIRFIDSALKNSIHDEGLLFLSKGILTYYWINEIEGKEIINASLTKIKNQAITNYVKIRFKNK